MQTQTSNTLHNAIMEAGSKDRPPMLAPDEASDSDYQDDPSFPRPPSKPPDAEFDFNPDSEEEILVVI
nr:hypothetical protein [Tanacetum cinerariifolium]